PCGDELRGVAGKKEVLEIHVAEKDLLVAAFEPVESAVGVFFEEMEVGEIVFNAIAVEVAEDSQGGFFVDKKKSAKVGVELLDAGARGDEIVIRAEVVEFHIDESLFDFTKKSRAARARAAHVAGRRNAAAIEKRFC